MVVKRNEWIQLLLTKTHKTDKVSCCTPEKKKRMHAHRLLLRAIGKVRYLVTENQAGAYGQETTQCIR